MSRKTFGWIPAVVAGLALVGLGLLTVTPRLAPTVEAQGPPTATPGTGQQTRQPSRSPARAQTAQSQRQAPAGARRDPFRAPVGRSGQIGSTKACVPSPIKRSLVIAHLSVSGIVKTPTEMIAMVTMSGRPQPFFLRERDELCDGYVSQITQDNVIFQERVEDAYGKEYEKEVIKTISGPGAQQ
ncbi:MAG: hypothetical protein V3U28_01285 [Candidatus Acidoferrales bacterium]